VKNAWFVAAAVFVFHIATASIYSYHRDEFYYLAQGRRLAWGYVDNPPLTPFLYRIDSALFGTSRLALAVMPALLHAGLVVVTALVARELGGNGRAAFLAALGAAIAPVFVTTGHFLGTVTPETLLGAATALFVVRVIRTDDPRWWLVVGIMVGLGMLDHWTIALFVIGLGVGLLVTPQRTLLWSPWTAAGALVALLIVLPNLVWQAQHDWVQLTFAKHLRDYGVSLRALPVQFVILGAASVLLALPGLLWLMRDDAARPYRALAIAFFLTLVLVIATGGKEYYTAAALPMLLAAGGVHYQHASWALPVALVGIGVLFLPFSTPLLPLSTAESVRSFNPEIAEMVGWSHVVDVVRPIAAAHPGAPIITSNYSEAGAIELLGKPNGMPQPYSGALTYWYWGRPHGVSDEVIVLGLDDHVKRWFADVQPVATIHTPHGVHNKEDGTTVWLARGQRENWEQLWPQLQHY
jgi:4-amino-4-deoxy-L-arabinose transferase-like glycosyltransferase